MDEFLVKVSEVLIDMLSEQGALVVLLVIVNGSLLWFISKLLTNYERLVMKFVELVETTNRTLNKLSSMMTRASNHDDEE